ncbi:hypothetical protein PsYK624_152500 [Phanerochaete sordida]|uniref:DUF6534 domain-containing protein n=1 Tax=Phanerochaete sordida TaxID=48140 RepID=A0A9P3LM56_9APHY|nr:hypothetical protein PsYK624_152500 [Phanerochaete sordida]
MMPPSAATTTDMSQLASKTTTVHFDNTLGAVVIGFIVIAVLYGVSCVHFYRYANGSSSDGSIMRGTIYVLWGMDTLYLVVNSFTVYYYAVTNFTDPLALTWSPWSAPATMIIADFIELTVTLIYAYRIFRLSGSQQLLICIVLPQFGGFGSGIAVGILEHRYSGWEEWHSLIRRIWYAALALQTTSDCTIAVSLCVILIRCRTGSKRNQSLIRTLILYSIYTCALTSSASIAAIVTYALMLNNLVYSSFAMLCPKLMCNSLLAWLNSREALRSMYAGQVVSVHLTGLSYGNIMPSQTHALTGLQVHGLATEGEVGDVL